MPSQTVEDDDGRIFRSIHCRMCKRTYFAPILTERSIERVLLREEFLNFRMVGFPCVVLPARKPVFDFVLRPFIFQSEVHEKIPSLNGGPNQCLIAIERIKVQDPCHAVHD